jgi:hypothetical protein
LSCLRRSELSLSARRRQLPTNCPSFTLVCDPSGAVSWTTALRGTACVLTSRAWELLGGERNQIAVCVLAATAVGRLASMVDSAVWVTAFTGATAVLASWVTSQGNARASRIQAEASARAQQHGHIREVRRTAYLELMEQAHITGEFYWRLGDVYVQLTDADAQLVRIEQLRADLRDAFAPLMRCVRVVVLEGPLPVAEAAEALQQAAAAANSAMRRISLSEADARSRFEEAHSHFRRRLESFIEAARAATDTA